jgi:predicted RNA-binding protein Jag
VEQWYTKQKSELMKLHSTAMDQVRIKHVNEGLLKAKIEEVEQWYTKQKSELMKLHSTAMDQVRTGQQDV